MADLPQYWETSPRGVQSSGKSYIPTYQSAWMAGCGAYAGWEAEFRLTGSGKPATDGVSGLIWRLLPFVSLVRPPSPIWGTLQPTEATP